MTGLTNGTAYTFTVVATNAEGNSPASDASAPVTPAGLPGEASAIAVPVNSQWALLLLVLMTMSLGGLVLRKGA